MSASDQRPPAIPVAMVIDDEVVDLMLYRRICDRSGLVGEILDFKAADHALEFLIANPDRQIDVIFLDINMPRMTGFEFLDAATQQLGQRFTKLCIVMLTTSLAPEDREKATQYDVVRDFLYKPLSEDDLRNVASLLDADGSAI